MPLRRAVPMTDRVRAGTSAPQRERKPLVTFRKTTLGLSARSAPLLVSGTWRSVMKVKNWPRHRLVWRMSLTPAAVVTGMATRRSSRRSAVARYCASVVSLQGCSTLRGDEKSEQIVDAGEGGAVAVLAERAGAVGLEDVEGETAQAGKHAGIGAEGGE